MSVPPKYRAIGDFHEYYSGKRKAPYLTLFVGGNHEASSHLHELYYGGWVAPSIYYLGAANVVRFGPLRIAGLSGIWNGRNYREPHHERVPYTYSETKSVYHVREIDVRKLLLLRHQVDVGISHDWPRGIEWHGDHIGLFQKKDLFEADAKAGTLGSAAAKYVMDRLRPPHWFSAHLHCKFAARVSYQQTTAADKTVQQLSTNGSSELPSLEGVLKGEVESFTESMKGNTGDQAQRKPVLIKNSDEIDLDLDDDIEDDITRPNLDPPTRETSSSHDKTQDAPVVSDELRAQLPESFSRPKVIMTKSRAALSASLPHPPTISNQQTNFLALDKCLPNRKFLQILDIDPPTARGGPSTPFSLTYDPEWLSILRVFAAYDPHIASPPDLGEAAYMPLIAPERQWVDEHLVQADKLRIPENFEQTAPVYDGKDIRSVGNEQPIEYNNPQTGAFCDLLDIPNWFNVSGKERKEFREGKLAVVQSQMPEGGRGGRGGGGGGRGRGRGRGQRGGRRGR